MENKEDFSEDKNFKNKIEPKKEKIKTLKKIVLIGQDFVVVSENGTNRRIKMKTENLNLKINDYLEIDI